MPGWRDVLSDSRRSIWQVLGVYLVAAWAVYQVALGLTDGLGLPAWVPPFAIVLIAAGLPIVIATALVQRTAPPERDPTLFPVDDVILPPRPAHRLQRVLTWRRSLFGGVAAFASLALATSGFMAMRHYGIGPAATLLAQGVIGEGQPVILADFAGDTALSRAVTEALRIDLLQSDVLRLEDPAKLRAPLERMQYDPAAGLPERVAREVAEREGYRAVIAGEIATLGGAYVLTARVIRADSGSAVASFKAVAKDSTLLIDAVEDLSRQIRGKAGESLREVRAAPPLERVSTGSLAALRKYSDALRVVDLNGDYMRGAALLQEVVALDSTFGMAWRRLGVMYGNLNARATDRDAAFRRAYALRDRMSEVERQLTNAAFHSWVERDAHAAIDAYRAVLELDPQNDIANNNLPVELMYQRRWAEAEAMLGAVPERDRSANNWYNLVRAQAAVGRAKEAQASVLRAVELLPRSMPVRRAAVELATAHGDYAAADSIASSAIASMQDNRTGAILMLGLHAVVKQTRGQWRAAEAMMRTTTDAAEQAGTVSLVLFAGLLEVEARLLIDPAAARASLARTLARVPLDSLPPRDREYLRIAGAYADLGEIATAREYIARYRQHVTPRPREDWDLEATEAYVALRMGNAAAALPVLRKYQARFECTVCTLPMLADAYLALGQPDSARSMLEQYLTFPEVGRVFADNGWRALALERVAQLHEQAGDKERAIARYAELTRLWQHADPELQPRVRAAGARVTALRGGG